MAELGLMYKELNMPPPARFLVWLLVYALVLYGVYLIIGLFPIPTNLQNVIVIVIAIVMLISLIYYSGIMGPPTPPQ